MDQLVRSLTLATALLAVCSEVALAAPLIRKQGALGDYPAGPQSLPGDNLPPWNMLDKNGRFVPMPKLEMPLHKKGELESTAPGPNLKVSNVMARAAVAACLAKGYRVGVAVVDSVGEARAMLTADGSDGSHVFVAMRKAETALVFEMPGTQALGAVMSGKQPISRVTPDMFVMGGGVPIHRGGRIIGAIGVSGAAGAPPGKADEDCAVAGLRAAGKGFR